MPSPVQPSHSPSSAEGEKHARKQLDREIRDMVSAITDRVTDFHKPGSTNHMENDGEHGLSMVTLVGNNNGATMKSEFDEKSGNPSHGDEPEALSTYVNSNFQAINNSIMLGGSYQANDPGVHLDISDFTDQPPESHHHKVEKPGKKGKKKDKEGSKSDHQFAF